MPETFVSSGPYGPRISIGWSGFGSKVSCCPGPPESQKRMQFSAFTSDDGADHAGSAPASDIPSAPIPPIWKISRRVSP